MKFVDRYLVLKENLRLALGTREALTFLFRYKYGQKFVSDNTDIVIEGAPSSGNSFAVMCFELAQKRVIKIAHHLHIPLQVILAVKKNIPCIVLVREPLDAAISITSRRGRFRPNEPFTVWLIRQRLWYWKTFYSRVKPYLDNCVLCSFGDLKQRYSRVIEAVNAKYGTTFTIPTSYDAHRALSLLDSTVSPTDWREGLKRDMKVFAENERSLVAIIEECRDIYSQILGKYGLHT